MIQVLCAYIHIPLIVSLDFGHKRKMFKSLRKVKEDDGIV